MAATVPGEARIRRRDVRFALVFAALQLLAYGPVFLLMYGLSAMWSPEGQSGQIYLDAVFGVLVMAVVVFAVAFVIVLGLSAVTGVLDWVVREPDRRDGQGPDRAA